MNHEITFLLASLSVVTICFSSVLISVILPALNQIELKHTEKNQDFLRILRLNIVALYVMIQILSCATLLGLFIPDKPELWVLITHIIMTGVYTYMIVSMVFAICKSSEIPIDDINTNEKDKKEVTSPL